MQGNQSGDLFEALIRDRIHGLPTHITRMSIHLSINPNLPPYVDVERALSGDDGNLIFAENRFNDEIIIVSERYRLEVFDGNITAKKEPK